MRIVLALLLSTAVSVAAADKPKSKPKDKQTIGRYAISGEWRLDTKTGRVEKLSVIYDRQIQESAKDIRSKLSTGETLLSVDGEYLGSVRYYVPLHSIKVDRVHSPAVKKPETIQYGRGAFFPPR